MLIRTIIWMLVIAMCQFGETKAVEVTRVHRPFDITFVGDSVVRYQYLAFVYAVHFKTPHPPDFLIRETLFNSWVEFYKNTTTLFDSAMLCDCYRYQADFIESRVRENRYYNSRDGRLRITYLQKFGHHKVFGFNKDRIRENFNIMHDTHDWAYDRWDDLLEQRVQHTDLLVLSAGHHSMRNFTNTLDAVIAKAQEVAKAVVWMETSPPRGQLVEGRVTMKPFDVRVKNELCPLSKPSNCTFAPFPFHTLKVDDFWDLFHFSHTYIYSAITRSALTLGGVCAKYQDLCDLFPPARQTL